MATKIKAKAPKKNEFMSQASLEALLRFGPQQQALNDLRQSATDTYGATLASARSTAAGTQAAIDAARPGVRDLYNRTLGDQAARQSVIAPILANLRPSADPIRGASAVEQGVVESILKGSKASALTSLARQRVGAAEGRQWQEANAGRQLQDDLRKVFRSKEQLAQQEGTFTSLTASKLADAAAKQETQLAMAQARLDQSDINNRRSTSASRDNAQLAADTSTANNRRSNSRRGGTKGLTQEQKQRAGAVADAVWAAKDQWNALRNAKDSKTGEPMRYSSTKIRQILQSVYKFDHGVVNAAADLAINGVISKKNVDYLHARNVILGKYRLPYARPGVAKAVGDVVKKSKKD